MDKEQVLQNKEFEKANAEVLLMNTLQNESSYRSQLLVKMLDPRRDIDTECGYPKEIDIDQYKYLYKREGIGKRIVGLYPEESWSMDPEIVQNEDTEQTIFEEEWEALQDKFNIYHYLHRVDELSGIGTFGILLLGFDDGEDLSTPLLEVTSTETKTTAKKELSLLFLRAFDQKSVTICTKETDITNPRYGQPLMYSVTFREPIQNISSTEKAAIGAGDPSTSATSTRTQKIHWSRVLHVADNREESEVYGTPRMQPVYNRIYDIRKVLSGSGEMFWKGAFPGLAFEMDPKVAAEGGTIDQAAVKEQVDNYQNGLQRYLAAKGLSVKSLSPQVADPKGHIEEQMRYIAITLGIPYRIFLGTEEAKLASSQDTITWNKRVSRRREKYLTPMMLRPFIDRLVLLGVIADPGEEGYKVVWPDLNAPTDADKAEVGVKRTEAMAKYVAGGVDAIIPPEEYMTILLGMPRKEVEQIIESAGTYIRETEDEEDLMDEEGS